MTQSATPSEKPRAGALRDLLEARLADSGLAPGARKLLLDAFEEEAGPSIAPKTAYLKSVAVRGFRGIGEHCRLDIAPKPGLTLVTGPNGSGKSSFAEGIEIALTGDNARWKSRSDIWRRSWRNLHHNGDPQVEVELFLPGDAEAATVHRAWQGEDVADSRAELRSSSGTTTLSSLGWEQGLSLYRPFLSYSELGQIISGRPSDMYDAVATILGLEALSTADKRLRERAKRLDTAVKQVNAEKPGLIEELSALDDPRAREAVDALTGHKPDPGTSHRTARPRRRAAGDAASAQRAERPRPGGRGGRGGTPAGRRPRGGRRPRLLW
ncbi:energy-coupling factor transporter ATP-binding protein EcfA2 [Spinactinospora alkalitolerans]|uniref:Nuclease SbcCD subunit C n=1 Tax=Spinactinospora alkalitolerans TaxID=687207 RepID=A0A852U4I0_9ACTN|nr:AAA family ATPase [Spinactinospora alkalitolerans]NYE48860.1 energy-coupling factor transporter ATP-binding protein EcfA2 [Spinactinospora alkalitolerans]